MEIGQKINWGELLPIIGQIILAILGVYEVLVRLFPTVKDWTILGNIIKFLSKISDWLNNTNKKKII